MVVATWKRGDDNIRFEKELHPIVEKKPDTESKRTSYDTNLALQGVSALIATLHTAIQEADTRPTDETISNALYSIEVQLDQIALDIEHHDKEEIARLHAIADYTNIPMARLYEMI